MPTEALPTEAPPTDALPTEAPAVTRSRPTIAGGVRPGPRLVAAPAPSPGLLAAPASGRAAPVETRRPATREPGPWAPAAGPARLLAELTGASPSGDDREPGTARTVSLAGHRRRHPRPPAPGATPRDEIIAMVERAGLRGRGGAGFPTGRKLRTVANRRGRPVVVVNGAEGEPASGKDRLLLTRLPHLVLDGALLAAAAVGADEVMVGVDRTNGDALAAVRRAIVERSSELAGVAVRVAATPPRYVAGEETGLVRWLNGGPAQPTFGLPRPSERGVLGRPTLVQNVETLAHLAQIAAYGPEWFRRTGPADDPGTTLVSVSGAVARPSVVEVAIGTPVDRLVAAAGGVAGPVQAVLFGGFFGAWVGARDALAAPFSRAGLGPLGAGPGAGVAILLPEGACGLAETARVLAWYAAESAGQCGPCLYGLADLAAGATALARGAASAADCGRLRRWADDIEGRGGCKHPDGAVRLLRSALAVFRADVDRHVAGEPCRGSSWSPTLSVPVPPAGVWR